MSNPKLSWNQTLLYSVLPLGSYFARIIYLNGSMDKWYFMIPLFFIPPYSIIPMLFMKYGMIKKGTGANPIDPSMVMPIIAKFILPLIIPEIFDNEMFSSFLILFFLLILILIVNINRRFKTCENITLVSFGKAFIDSIITLGGVEISMIIVPFIPKLGDVLDVLMNLSYIGPIITLAIWSGIFIFIYSLSNMINQKDIRSFCRTPFKGSTKDQVLFFLFLIFLVLSFYINIVFNKFDDSEIVGGVLRTMEKFSPIKFMPGSIDKITANL